MGDDPKVIYDHIEHALDGLLIGLEEKKEWSLHKLAGTLKMLLDKYMELNNDEGT